MLQPGDTLQRGYVIEKVLGQGGMGAVYLARQNTLGGRRVAIKEMLIRGEDTSVVALVAAQFRREAEILASIEHPNLVDVRDYFEESGRHYMVMAFIDGETLEEVLNRSTHPLRVSQVLDWMDQLCDVLSVLHEHAPPVIVRDLKPSNVMIDHSGRLRLIDFGIARIDEGEGARTSTFLKGAGTVGFAPMEQFGGGGTDARTDVYALGATIYCLLTRKIPPWSMQLVTGEATLDPPSRGNPGVPPQLDEVVLKMMALRRDARYQTVREARKALLETRASVREVGPLIDVARKFCINCGATIVVGVGTCKQCGDDLEKQGEVLVENLPPVPPVRTSKEPDDDMRAPSRGLQPRGRGIADAELEPKKRRSVSWLIAVAVAGLATAAFSYYYEPAPTSTGRASSPTPLQSVVRRSPPPRMDAEIALQACESNLKNVAAQLEAYGSDHDGRYPKQLADLVPGYVQSIPTCPAGNAPYAYFVNDAPVSEFTVFCGGWQHKDVHLAAYHPLYDSIDGLQDRNKYLDITPITAQEYVNRGIAYNQTGDNQRAVADYSQALSQSPGWVYAYYNRGLAYADLKEYRKTVEDETAALGIYKSALYFTARGNAYAQLDDYDDALSDFLAAYKLDESLDTYGRIAFTYYKMGRFGEATEACDAMLARDPKSQDACVTRYWCELSQGEGAAAASDAQRFLTNFGWKAYQSPYSVIVGYLAYRMDHKDGDARALIASGLERLDTEWPYPCVQYLGGQLAQDALITQAGTDTQKLTELHTYLGLKAAVEGNKEEARGQLQWVRDYGYKPYLEYRAALSWLARL